MTLSHVGKRDLAELPQEVLATVVARLPPCEAVQLQRVSRNFRRAAAASGKLEADVVNQLLKVLSRDGQSGPAVLAACTARRWLARNAADVLFISPRGYAAASACTSLISCLPALQQVELAFDESPSVNDYRCLLEALAWCPGLRSLKLCMEVGDSEEYEEEQDDESDGFALMPAAH